MKKANLMASLALHAIHARPAGVMANPRADAGGVADALKDVKAQLAGMRDDVMAKAETALAEAKRTGEVSVELKAQIDALLPKFNEATATQAKLQGRLEGLEARNVDLEQLFASGGGRGAGRTQTVGAEIAQSDELKAYVANGLNGSLNLAPQAAITTVDNSGGGVIWSEREQEAVNMPQRRLLLRQLLNVVNTGAGVIDYPKQVARTNAAAPVAEAAAAPASNYGWTKDQVNIRKISHVTHVSDEALADSGQLQGLIDGEMRYGLDLEEETQILSGAGTGETLTGLITEATAFAAAVGLPNTDRLDRLRLAILQVVLNDYAADAIILNPTDWAAIELQREATGGKFIIGGPDAPAGPSLWRLPVVESNTMTANEWLVGAMFMAATLYDRQQSELLISSEHGTNFIDGMKTMKATKRVALAVKRPASLVTGNFTFI